MFQMRFTTNHLHSSYCTHSISLARTNIEFTKCLQVSRNRRDKSAACRGEAGAGCHILWFLIFEEEVSTVSLSIISVGI